MVESADADTRWPPAASASFRLLQSYTETFEDDDILEMIRWQLSTALEDFPELIGRTVTVARVPPVDYIDSPNDPVARAHPYNDLIELPNGEQAQNITLYHELAHLAIYHRHFEGEDVPRTSEEYTSLVALERMDPGQLYADRVPYFGEPAVPRDEWPAIAADALAYRDENGANSHYVQRAKEWFDGGDRA